MCLGIPGKVVELTDESKNEAMIEIIGVRRKVDLSCVLNEERRIKDIIGNWVLVHVGFAIAMVDEQEAERTLKILEELGEIEEEKQAMSGTG